MVSNTRSGRQTRSTRVDLDSFGSDHELSLEEWQAARHQEIERILAPTQDEERINNVFGQYSTRTKAEMGAAFRALSEICHPDKQTEQEWIEKANEAQKVIVSARDRFKVPTVIPEKMVRPKQSHQTRYWSVQSFQRAVPDLHLNPDDPDALGIIHKWNEAVENYNKERGYDLKAGLFPLRYLQQEFRTICDLRKTYREETEDQTKKDLAAVFKSYAISTQEFCRERGLPESWAWQTTDINGEPDFQGHTPDAAASRNSGSSSSQSSHQPFQSSNPPSQEDKDTGSAAFPSGSNSPLQGSDAPVQGSDALVQDFDALVQDSDALVQDSDAPVQGSDAPVQGSDAPVQGSDAPIQGSDAPIQGSDAPVQGSDTPVQGSDAPVQEDVDMDQEIESAASLPSDSSFNPPSQEHTDVGRETERLGTGNRRMEKNLLPGFTRTGEKIIGVRELRDNMYRFYVEVQNKDKCNGLATCEVWDTDQLGVKAKKAYLNWDKKGMIGENARKYRRKDAEDFGNIVHIGCKPVHTRTEPKEGHYYEMRGVEDPADISPKKKIVDYDENKSENSTCETSPSDGNTSSTPGPRDIEIIQLKEQNATMAKEIEKMMKSMAEMKEMMRNLAIGVPASGT
ncbi:MAG: hypothetical protein MMC33_005975 [Icmadophila ericetorum]|nr:hypothetical protein [Icmadophila ericetorum]